MNALLAVSSDKRLLQLQMGEPSFWCVSQPKEVQRGDWILMYFKGKGLLQLFEVQQPDPSYSEVKCQMRGLHTVRTRLLLTLEAPVSVSQMKADPVVRKMTAVSRNFQGTSFHVNPQELRALLSLIRKANPAAKLPLP